MLFNIQTMPRYLNHVEITISSFLSQL